MPIEKQLLKIADTLSAIEPSSDEAARLRVIAGELARAREVRNKRGGVNGVEVRQVIYTRSMVDDSEHRGGGVYIEQWWEMDGQHLATRDPRESAVTRRDGDNGDG